MSTLPEGKAVADGIEEFINSGGKMADLPEDDNDYHLTGWMFTDRLFDGNFQDQEINDDPRTSARRLRTIFPIHKQQELNLLRKGGKYHVDDADYIEKLELKDLLRLMIERMEGELKSQRKHNPLSNSPYAISTARFIDKCLERSSVILYAMHLPK